MSLKVYLQALGSQLDMMLYNRSKCIELSQHQKKFRREKCYICYIMGGGGGGGGGVRQKNAIYSLYILLLYIFT